MARDYGNVELGDVLGRSVVQDDARWILRDQFPQLAVARRKTRHQLGKIDDSRNELDSKSYRSLMA